MIRRPPSSTRTDTLFPYPTLFRSIRLGAGGGAGADVAVGAGAVLDHHGLPELRGHFLGHGAGNHVGGAARGKRHQDAHGRSEEHTSELQSLMRNSYAVFCLKKKISTINNTTHVNHAHITQQI